MNTKGRTSHLTYNKTQAKTVP